MPKLDRKSAKLFAENASAQAGGIAQFGSLAAGTPNYSKDPDVIQGLSQYSDGWSAACLGTKSPALEDRNALDYLLSYQQAYIMQHGVPEWLSTETYYEHSYVVDSNGELRVSVIDNNTGHDPTLDNGGSYWGYAGARGSGKQIGEVYFSQSSDGNDNKGALPLFTGEVIVNADQVYPQFYAWVLAHTGLCVTEAQWQTAVTTYGECSFYVIDDTNKTIRLPKILNIGRYLIDSYNNDKAWYRVYSDGWCEQGNTNYVSSLGEVINLVKPFIDTGYNVVSGGHSSNGYGNTSAYDYTTSTFKAWTSDDESFNASDICWEATGYVDISDYEIPVKYPWVFAYNAAIPASTAQAAQFQAALSGKADVADLAEVQCVVETYHSGTEWYRVWSDGWCEQGGKVQSATSVTLLKPYLNTDYSLVATADGGTSSSSASLLSVYNKTSTGFYVTTSENRYSVCWRTAGYIS